MRPGPHTRLQCGIVCLVALLATPACLAQEEPDPQLRAAVQKAAALLGDQGPRAAIDHLRTLEGDQLAMDAWFQLCQALYWQKRDLPALVAVARAGLQDGQTRAERLDDAARRETLLGTVKALAYNLASFTWPGWSQEEGITISPADREAGCQAARLNLELAEQLDRPPRARSAAYWITGAHQLAAGQYPEALASFEQARTLSREAEDQEGMLMNEGYLALTRVLAPAPAPPEQEYDKALQALEALGTDDATFYADQIKTARVALAAADRPDLPRLHAAGPLAAALEERAARLPGLLPGLSVAHTTEGYAEILEQARPGDLLCLLLAADHPDLRLPGEIEDLLPLPRAELMGRLEREETVVAPHRARHLRVLLLAAPTQEALLALIQGADLLQD